MTYQSPFKKTQPVQATGGYKSPFGVTASQVMPEIKTLPKTALAGGGAYYFTKPGELYTPKDTHTTYGGKEAQGGLQRDDIIPAALGGANVSKENIRMEPTTATDFFSKSPIGTLFPKVATFLGGVVGGKNTATDKIEMQNINDFKSGKISLGEARMNVLIAKDKLTEPWGQSQSVIKNLPSAVGDTLKQGAGYLGDFFKTVVGIPVAIYQSLAHPTEETKKIEKIAAGEASFNPKTGQMTPIKMSPLDKVATAMNRTVAKGFVRIFNPIVQEAGKDVGEIIATNEISKQVQEGKMPASALDDIAVLKKSKLQIVGDVAQAVLAAYMPSVELGIAKNAVGGTLREVVLGSLNKGLVPSALFGGAQVLSSGAKDPATVAKIMAQNIISLNAFNVGMSIGLNKIANISARIGQIKNQVVTPEIKIVLEHTQQLLDDKQFVEQMAKDAKDGISVNLNDPTIKYQAKPSLGKGPDGKPILAKTVINKRTGENMILYNAKLDKDVALKLEVLNNEHNFIYDSRFENIDQNRLSAGKEPLQIEAPKTIEPVVGEGFTMKSKSNKDEIELAKAYAKKSEAINRYSTKSTVANLEAVKKSKTVLQKLLDDFAQKQNKTPQHIGLKIQKEISRGGETPTLDAVVKHKTDLGQDTHITTKDSLIKDTLMRPVEPREQATLDNLRPQKPSQSPETAPTGEINPDAGKTTKTSKIATSIETKAIEEGLSSGFPEKAGYEPRVIKEQAAKIGDLMKSDIEKAKNIIKGNEAVPEGISGTYLIKAMEDYAMQTGDVQLIKDIANSPLTSATSIYGSEIRMAAERNPDSAVAKLQEVKQAREEAFKGKTKKTAQKAVAETAKEIKNEIAKKSPTKENWSSFIESITC